MSQTKRNSLPVEPESTGSGKEYPKNGNCSKKRRKGRSNYVPRQSKNMDQVVSNDISYYNKNPYEFEHATKIPWVPFMGDDFKSAYNLIYRRYEEGTTDTRINKSMPGIMILDYVYGPGWAIDPSDATNRAFSEMMQDMYSKTSSNNLNFTQADLAMYLTSMQSIVVQIANAKRVFELSQFWITRNLYYPRATISALGFSYDDIMRNYNAYVTRLNALIRMFNNIKIPSFLDIYDRQYTLAHNVYVDEDSSLGQIYMFKPAGYYQYSDTQHMATWYSKDTWVDMDEYLNTLENMLNGWYTSGDLYTINGALLRAYKDAPFVSIPEYTDTIASPQVDDIMMMQLMNATIIPVDQSTCSITQGETGEFVTWNPAMIDVSQFGSRWMLRAFKETISAEDNMEMTRFTNLPLTFETRLRGCNPEIICKCTIYTMDRSQPGAVNNVATFTESYFGYGYDANVHQTLEYISAILSLSNFRYIPLLNIYFNTDPNDTNSGEIETQPINFVGDIYNWTFISAQELELLNKVAQYSLWKPKRVSSGGDPING